MSAGVNLVGYLDAEVGTGEAARLVATALTAAGVAHTDVGEIATASRREHPFPVDPASRARHPVNLLCINADMLPAFARRVGRSFFAGRHTIGFWFWEVASAPPGTQAALRLVDEVWVASHHVADAFAPVADRPVIRMPLPVPGAAAASAPLPAAWPAGPAFLFAFDHLSVFARKNPLGAVEAFARAFPRPRPEGPFLVLKSINGDQAPDARGELLAAARERPDIVVLDAYVTAAEMHAMTAACLAYVSLHRAEGFGLTMAQAMARGRPVIATGYSGNLDFMTPFNAYLVDHALVRVGPGAAPYQADAVWADPDLDHAAWAMRRILERPDEAAARGARAREELCRSRSPAAAGAAMRDRLDVIATAGAPGGPRARWRQRARLRRIRR